ncbi:MAG: hypothetical protein ACEQSR_11080 [Candidatus Methylacidiphilales bacterium]
MKYTLLLITSIWTQVVYAQINTKNKVLHQVELGINHANFLTKNPNFNNVISGYHLGYKVLFKNHAIKIHLAYNLSSLIYPKTPNLGVIAMDFRTFNFGYNYIFPFKLFSVDVGCQISYRYEGGEAAVYGYRNPTSPLSEPVEARLKYNSIGFSPNAEIEYFITKNFGLGVNLNYYPFENAKLKGDGTNEPDPLYVQIYKPNNLNFTSTFKLAYKFSFSKKNID